MLRAVVAPTANAIGAAKVQWTNEGAKGQLKIDAKFATGATQAPRDGWEKTQNGGFISRTFLLPLAEILSFPFFYESRAAVISIPQNATPEE